MRILRSISFAFVATLAAQQFAHGFPNAIYNPSNGNIVLINDTDRTLAAIYVISEGRHFTTDPSDVLPVIGAIRDIGDLPLGVTYLNFPPTGIQGVSIGNVVTPYTPTSDLSGAYYFTFPGPAIPLGTPEPATAGLAGVGLAVVATARRRRRG